MKLGLDGKVALITGGSQGLGRAIGVALAREGCSVALCARRPGPLQAVADDIASAGGDVLAVPCDVSDAAAVDDLFRQIRERYGRLDILVNNAGISSALPFETANDDAWQADLELKLFAAIRCSRLALPFMRAAGGGRIVNMLNIGAKAPAAGSLPTAASRAAGLALTKALSREYAAERILVNAVCIGIVRSGQWERRWERDGRPGTLDEFYAQLATEREVPVGRIAAAEELADLVLFLVSERAAYITGVAINFDGGASPVT
jgi:3-oxoacyl-[acyl-carrier protein] reductase